MVGSNKSGFCWAEVDLNAIRENICTVRNKVGHDRKVMAVLKSDAYGHGMGLIAKTLINEGLVEGFAVADSSEGTELRRLGISAPILILESIFTEHVHEIVSNDLTSSLYSLHLARKLDKEAGVQNKKIKVHIKVNTGYESSGVGVNECVSFIKCLEELKNIEIEGIFTHLISAYEDDRSLVYKQIKLFDKVLDSLREKSIHIPLVHAANSPGILEYPESHYDMVRVGTLMYGLSLPNMDPGREYKPVMQLKSRINSINRFDTGQSFGYDNSSPIEAEKTLATVSIGYCDASFLLFSDNLEVIVKGKRAPVIGKARMGTLTIDVTGIHGAEIGDEVVIFGSQGDETITAAEISTRTQVGITRCESVCFLGKRVVRIYMD